jgi:diguanylate cyclase (GGDEF)-like protein
MAITQAQVVNMAPPAAEGSDVCPQILVADDSRATREIIKNILGNEFSVFEFADGASLWERIEGGIEAKALITDIDMPGMDGVELIGRIRKSEDERLRNLPIIAITGAEDQQTRRRAFLSGATGFIIKPIDAVQLQALMHAYVHHDKVKRELDQKSEALEQQSVTDALTGLRSRRYFMDRGGQDLAFCMRREKDLSLIRIDIAQFSRIRQHHDEKRVNELLRWFGKILLSNARVEDTVARLSDAEFAILAMATNTDAATVVCNRLQEAIAANPFNDGNIAIPISFIAGIADLQQDRAPDIGAMLSLAQERLTAASPNTIEPTVGEAPSAPISEFNSFESASPALPDREPTLVSTSEPAPVAASRAPSDQMETMSVEELEQLIRQETVGKNPAPANIESALRLLEHGKGDQLRPHIEKIMRQLQPLIEYYESYCIKK